MLILLMVSAKAQLSYTTGDGSITITRYTGSGGVVIVPSTIDGLPVGKIGDYAFAGSAVTSVTVPDSVTSIASEAIKSCGSLTNIVIGSGVTNIAFGSEGLAPFFNCPNLMTIEVSAGNTTYSSVDGVLFDKSEVTLIEYPQAKAGSYTVPGGVTTIAGYAFIGCGGLVSVTIPDRVTTIQSGTFENCQNLTSVALGTSVTNVDYTAFFQSAQLTKITVNSLNPLLSSVDGVLFDKSGTTLMVYPGGKQGSYRVPDGVVEIAAGAFSGCSGVTTVTIPEGVTSVDDGAFNDCQNLTSVNIPKTVTTIGDDAFINSPSLATLPVDPLNAIYSSDDGVLFNKNQTVLIECPAAKAGSYTIPDTVARVADLAFFGCALLTSVTIPDGVTEIGDQAFTDCSGLTRVAIGRSVTKIGTGPEGAFAWCESLSAITVDPLNSAYSSLDGVLFDKNQSTLILCPAAKAGSYVVPTGVNRIAGSAFEYCTELTSVTIPGSVTEIGDRAFEECSAVTAIYFLGNAPSLGTGVFSDDQLAVVYYLPGSAGWEIIYGSLPTVLLWNPQVQISGSSLGARSNRFGFTVTGATNWVFVVEAATDLANAVWLPLSTNVMTTGSAYFSDPDWRKYAARYYRLRYP
jgi:hypothetical protein